MKSVTITLHEGTRVTWSREKDDLREVEVNPSGALEVYVAGGDTYRGHRLKHAYSIGLWIEFDVEYDG